MNLLCFTTSPALKSNTHSLGSPSRPQELQGLFIRPMLGQHAISQVWPIETGHVAARLAQLQLRDDVFAHPLGCGGRQRHPWHGWEQLLQSGKLPVFRTEIMAPL